MFYSQSLLSRNGPLGLLWIAASSHKRLNKTQVAAADLLSFIGKILLDDFPLVSSRILGTLLLGVSRIYSMQVGYLLDDCHKTLNEIGHFVKNRASRKQIMNALILPSNSIVVPERFELDSFNLEMNIDYVERDSGRLNEHMMDEDAWGNEIIGCHPSAKIDAATLDVFSATSHTHAECTLPSLPEYSLKMAKYSIPSFKAPQEKLLPEDDIHGDIFLGTDEELFELITQSSKNTFTYSWHMNQTDEIKTDELQTLDVMKNGFNDVCDGNDMKLLLNDQLEKCSAKFPTRLEEYTESSETLKNGVGVSDLVTVATPTKKENARTRQKRKCQIDDVIVLPNKFIKQSLEDVTDLVCKRRKCPHTTLDVWRALHISNLYDTSSSFPLLPFYMMDSPLPKSEEPLEFCRHQDENIGADGVDLSPASPPPLVVLEISKPVSPTTDKNSDMALIAPDTPVDFPSSRRFQKGIKPPYGEESTSSSECMCKENLMNNQDIDLNLIEEHAYNDEGNTHEGGRWSWRTRRLAKYLQKSFDSQREKANESVMSLFHVIKGKSRKDGARLFYEILVLKTEGCIDVVQDDSFGDILLFPMKT